MFRPVPMSQISLIVLRRDLERVTLEMVRLGAVHLYRVEEIDPWTAALDAMPVEERLTAIEHRLNEVDTLLVKLDLRPTLASLPTEPPKTDLDALGQTLQVVGTQVDAALAKRRSTADEIRRIGTMLEMPVAEVPAAAAIDPSTRFAFLETFMGTMNRAHIEVVRSELAQLPNIIIPFRARDGAEAVLIMVLKKDRAALTEALSKVRATPLRAEEGVAPSEEMRAQFAQRIKELKQQEDAARRELEALKTRHGDALRDARAALEIERTILNAQETLRGTAHTTLISAWVSTRKAKSIAERLKTVARGRCYAEIRTPDEIEGVADGLVQVPVELSNPGFLKPFEMLVKGYDTPAYDGIDPTPIVGVTFLLMFGLMFGDIGQGLVVALVGWLIARRPTISSGMRRIGSLMIFCGISAIAFGVLYGKFFGMHVNDMFDSKILPWAFSPLDMENLENTSTFLWRTVYFGVGILSLGIILNIFLYLRKRDIFHAIFSPTGLMAGVAYWGIVAIIVKALAYKHSLAQLQWYIVGFVVAPLVLFILRGPIWKLFNRHAEVVRGGCMMYLVETMMEPFEFFITFLANTFSFVRIAAYALAHVGIFLAIFEITKMLGSLPSPLSALTQAFVIILGNAIVIALEGLVAGIQALRLEYYEFFSKFFRGGGTAFKPLGPSGGPAKSRPME